jgi:biotin operon repressor
MNQKPFIPNWIFEQGWNAHQIAIYSYVTMRGQCFEDKRKIMNALGISPKAFWKHLNGLIKEGWIVKSKKGKSSCLTANTEQQKPETKRDREAKIINMFDKLQEDLAHNGLNKKAADGN